MKKHIPFLGLIVLSGALLVPAKAADTKAVRITVDAGARERVDTPLSVCLKGIALPTGPLMLRETTGGQSAAVPCQIEQESLSWLLSGKTAAGAKRTFEIVPGTPPAGPAVTARKNDKTLELVAGDRKFLRYHFAADPAPAGTSPLFVRSGFIHPLWSPAGQVMTNTRPADHYHHMGLWNAWTSTEFEGRHTDFWNLKEGQGTVRFAKFAGITAGPVFGGFTAIQHHVDLKAPGGEKIVLEEAMNIRVWNPPAGQPNAYVLDILSTQRCASSSPLLLNKYRYGGYGFRAAADWKSPDVLTSEGKNRSNGHSTRSRWCDVFGTTDKGRCGIVFMSNPQNRAHPEPMRIWPKSSKMEDMFFNYCPIQEEAWTLEPGKDHVFRYRLYVYEGQATPELAERLWQDFATPPTITVEKP